jgi:hypothetical protein
MRVRRGVVLVLVAAVLVSLVPGSAYADVSVTRAELSGTRLRIEGNGAVANATITVDGTAMGLADAGGNFRIERDPFSSASCQVTVGDGSTSTIATLSGCTPTAPGKPTFAGFSDQVLVGDTRQYQAEASTPTGQLAFVFDWGDGTANTRDPATGFHTGARGHTLLSTVVDHTWPTAGTFTVTVAAVDETGRSTRSDPLTVTVHPPPNQNDCGSGADAGNGAADATTIILPVTCTGTLDGEFDRVDVYQFTVDRSFTLLSASRSPRTFDFDPPFALIDPDGAERQITFATEPLCSTTPCSGNFTDRFLNYTLDKAGTWKLQIGTLNRAHVGDYTLHAHHGGGGDDCADDRAPSAVPPPFDAPNRNGFSGDGLGASTQPMQLGPSEVNCRAALPPGDFDTADFYRLPINNGEAVAVAVLPDHDTQHCTTTSEVVRRTQIHLTTGGPFGGPFASNLSQFCLDYFDGAADDGNVDLRVLGWDGGEPPPPELSFGYRLQVATFSRHEGDCFTGADVGDSFANAHLVPLSSSSDHLPVQCIGDTPAGDEDWYRFSVTAGQGIRLLGRANVINPFRVFDPDGVDRSAELNASGGFLVADKSGNWRARVLPGAVPYGVAVVLSEPRVMTSFSIEPTTVVGGGTAQGSVSVAPTGNCHEIVLFSDNVAVADVPDAVTVCSGGTGSFTVSTTTVGTPRTVTITGSYANESRSVTMTVKPAPDTVAVDKAQYDSGKQQLLVEATSSNAGATLTVHVAATGELIGTLTGDVSGRYKGQFSWPVNPQSITVKSDLGGSVTKAVTAN